MLRWDALRLPQHWLSTILPPKCHSLWVAALILSEQRTEGAGSCPQRTAFEALRGPQSHHS